MHSRAPSFPLGNDGSDVVLQPRQAFDEAQRLIKQNEMEPAMRLLASAANQDLADAQFLLGTLQHAAAKAEQDDDQQPEAWNMDAEEKRQQANRADDPKDLRTIRKRARKAYMAYVRAKRAAAKAKAAAQANNGLIQHASVQELDHAFGTTLKRFLDPSVPVQPLKASLTNENEDAALGLGDETTAVEWIRRAADNGHRGAQVQLGNFCLSQDPPLPRAAIEWYMRVSGPKAPEPHPDALYNLGLLYYEGVDDAEPPFQADPKASLPFFMKAAEIGDPSAQYFVGHLLHQGSEELGVPANFASARMMLESAANKGHTGAMYYLAQLYRSGDPDHGVAADRRLFVQYLDQAVAHGDADALFCMADIRFHGSDGFFRDLDDAKRLYLEAAAAGNADAFCCLGAMYYNGLGVEQDYRQAFTYYQEAADRHSMEAWKNLAEMYYLGRGVPKNPATAESILKMLRKVDSATATADNK
ncbi:TPA: hypothetical protein N0F65_001027 [Lagenidium giganteum]|uniref:Uncharacterized protein n=1 Tax=Lagenidium giganteum TaxID=4803 RepID=A0AAV2YZ14_9STRA|nr:TPA: hypothetical protein N0F65_001027 [Lagenidium giganteum]